MRAVGRYPEAEDARRRALEAKGDFWRVGLELADLFYRTDRRAQAQRLYEALYDRYKRGIFTTADDLGVAGRAAAAMEQFHDANELFREKHNDADAQKTFERPARRLRLPARSRPRQCPP